MVFAFVGAVNVKRNATAATADVTTVDAHASTASGRGDLIFSLTVLCGGVQCRYAAPKCLFGESKWISCTVNSLHLLIAATLARRECAPEWPNELKERRLIADVLVKAVEKRRHPRAAAAATETHTAARLFLNCPGATV